MRQFEQGERVATCFRQDAFKHVLVERARKGRTQERACVRPAETRDGKVRQTREITRDSSRGEQERDVFGSQSTSHDGEGPRRLSVKPLGVINDTEHGTFGSHLGQEAKEGEAHEQTIGRRAGAMAERHTKGVSLGCWQLIKGGRARYAELLGCGKRELILGFVPDGAEHLESGRRLRGVAQQGGLSNSGIPVNHDRPAVTGRAHRPRPDRVSRVRFVARANLLAAPLSWAFHRRRREERHVQPRHSAAISRTVRPTTFAPASPIAPSPLPDAETGPICRFSVARTGS